jgi:intraflagellar transport protein 122
VDFMPPAFLAFHMAGCPEEAFLVLEELIKNAIFEARYHDAGYCHWVLSMQFLEMAADEYVPVV